MPERDQPERREPDLGPHPNLNKEPLRTGNRPETQADREDVIFRPAFWVIDRMSAGFVVLIIALVLLVIAIAAFSVL